MFGGKLANLNHLASDGGLKRLSYIWSHNQLLANKVPNPSPGLFVQFMVLSFKSFFLLRAFSISPAQSFSKNLIHSVWSSQSFKGKSAKNLQYKIHKV